MLISKTAKVKWGNRNKAYYIDKGYTFTKNGDVFDVCINDLSPNSSKIFVECLCDYCLENGIETVMQKGWQDYIKKFSDSSIEKDCCYNCRHLKKTESDFKNYGVSHTSKLDKTINKMQETNIEKYGFIAPIINEGIKEKIRNTNYLKYGANTPSKNEEVKKKIKNTNIRMYGFKSPTLNKNIRAKQLSAMSDKYGVQYPMQDKSIQEKARNSLFLNETGVSSKQQRYIHELYGGELNYPFNNLSLDIAFPSDKIYIECDFGGHELQVKFGNLTQDEFNNREKRRSYLLYRRGWKEIRIISKSDKIPSDEVLLNMYDLAIKHLNENHHFIKFDIDNGTIITSEFVKKYDYQNLTRL